MSVVAGFSVLDGVFIGADCRATAPTRDGGKVHADCLQKLVPVQDHTVLGFVGDVELAGYFLHQVISELKSRRRTDPVSISSWLPRKFRHLAADCGTRLPPKVMVASVLRDRPNVVASSDVSEMIARLVQQGAHPRLGLMDLLMANRGTERIAVPSTAYPLLYTLGPPDYIAQKVPPLRFAAIGTGSGSKVNLQHYSDTIAGCGGFEEFAFRFAIEQFMSWSNEPTVGGLLPAFKLEKSGVRPIELSAQIPAGSAPIGIRYADKRWYQVNTQSGKCLRLIPPWEFRLDDLKAGVFDDYRHSWEREFGGARRPPDK